MSLLTSFQTLTSNEEKITFINRSLVRNKHKEVIELFSNEEQQSTNIEFLKNLGKKLSDPDFDYLGLVKVAKYDWQIKALSHDLLANSFVVSKWKQETVQRHMAKCKAAHTTNPTLAAAVDEVEKQLLADLEKLEQAKAATQAATNELDPIDSTRLNTLVTNHVLPAKQLFAWENLLSIASGNFALRHVGNLDDATCEFQEQQTAGDALAISNGLTHFIHWAVREKSFGSKAINNYLPENDQEEYKFLTEQYAHKSGTMKQLAEQDMERSFLSKRLDSILQAFTPEEQQSLLHLYEKQLRASIYRSVFCLTNQIPFPCKGWKETWEKDITTSSSFLFISQKQPASPYDFESYYHFGKCGRGSIEEGSIRAHIKPCSMEQLAQFQEGLSDTTDKVAAVQEKYIDAILKQIIALAATT